jgi:hypothetical protein
MTPFLAATLLLAQVEGSVPAEQAAASPASPASKASMTAEPSPSPVAQAPDRPVETAERSEGSGRHVVEAAARVGIMLPGELSPANWFHTETQAAPTFGLDPSVVVHRHFAVGGYLQLTPFAFERTSGSNVIGEGSGAFVSGGVSAKARLPVGEQWLLRAGLTLGRNYVTYEGKSRSSGSPFELTGGGWNAGLVADGAWRASERFGASVQLGFFSQVSGAAEVKGPPTAATGSSDRDFRFAPVVFLTVGPELYL